MRIYTDIKNAKELTWEEIVKKGIVKNVSRDSHERYKKCYEVSFSDNYTLVG